MTEETIREKLVGRLAMLLKMDKDTIRPDARLEELGMDSMRFVDLFIFIENEFGVELISTDMQRADLETPQALAASIARNL